MWTPRSSLRLPDTLDTCESLDATYSLGSALSGVGVYSWNCWNGLAASDFADGWDWFYRSPRYWRRLPEKGPGNNVRVRLLSGSGNRSAARASRP